MMFSTYRKKYRSLFIIIAIIILIGGVSLAAFLVRYSATDEAACRRCHPEQAEMWINSKGHPAEKTSCSDCHSRGFEIIPEDWNIIKHARDQLAPPEYLADDKLTSQRCLECHEDVLNLGYEVKKRVIKFTHRYHLAEGLECVDCHRTAAHERLKFNTNRPSISECLECHLREFQGPPKNQKCLNCHDVMLAPGRTW
jgi:nitrate/TMAO reductase-like tetraheme cytochrome c subunit